MRVLVCEDEANVANFIRKGLTEQGLGVELAGNGLLAINRLKEQSFDIVLLDVVMPFTDGWEVCRQIRQELKLDIPVIMLTALHSTAEIVKGLNAGADDYLTKPFKMDELLARINAVVRRYKKTGSGELLEFAGLRMNLASGDVSFDTERIQLTAKEYRLLEYFLSNPNKILSREKILSNVWGIEFDLGTNVVDVYINYLRGKLEKAGCPRLIHTRVGLGYILKESDES